MEKILAAEDRANPIPSDIVVAIQEQLEHLVLLPMGIKRRHEYLGHEIVRRLHGDSLLECLDGAVQVLQAYQLSHAPAGLNLITGSSLSQILLDEGNGLGIALYFPDLCHYQAGFPVNVLEPSC